MDAVSIISACMAIVLVIERMYKYGVKHIKRSSCCGSTCEFRETGSDEMTN